MSADETLDQLTQRLRSTGRPIDLAEILCRLFVMMPVGSTALSVRFAPFWGALGPRPDYENTDMAFEARIGMDARWIAAGSGSNAAKALSQLVDNIANNIFWKQP